MNGGARLRRALISQPQESVRARRSLAPPGSWKAPCSFRTCSRSMNLNCATRCSAGEPLSGSWVASTVLPPRIGTMNWIVLVVVLVLEKRVGQPRTRTRMRTRTKGRFMERIPRNFRALDPEPGRDGALRRPRRAQRRNDAARCFAGGDIAARCPYQSQVHGKPPFASRVHWDHEPHRKSPSTAL